MPPDEIPAPSVDGRALSQMLANDDARAVRAANVPLSARVRAVGSGFRAFNAAEAAKADEPTLAHAHDDIFRAVRETTNDDAEALLDLRAFQMSAFLAAVHDFERTGVVSDELHQLGGTFVDRMEKVGWCEHHHLAMPEVVRRAAFKLSWNRVLLLDGNVRFALSLDETRTLYGFYFDHPHGSDSERARLEASLREASTPAARERVKEASEKAAAGWLLVKIGELSKLDPAYPTPLARAAALFMKHDYRASATLYQAWLDAHPGGAWTLRVQNHLRAALLAAETNFQ